MNEPRDLTRDELIEPGDEFKFAGQPESAPWAEVDKAIGLKVKDFGKGIKFRRPCNKTQP